MMKPISTLLVTAASAATSAFAQTSASDKATLINIDVVAFSGKETSANPFLDIYVAVPYEHLLFTQHEGSFVGEYALHVTVRDAAGRTIIDTTTTRTVVETSYTVTKGKTGKSDNVQQRFTAPPGSYQIDVSVNDAFGQRSFAASRKQTVPDFLSESNAISSILFVSDIEQKGNRYTIVPYIGEHVWSSEQRLFAFFEFYSRSLGGQVMFRWSIEDKDLRVLATGMSDILPVARRATQTFLPIVVSSRLVPDDYTLRLRAYGSNAQGMIDTNNVLATSERAYRVPASMAGDLLKDLRKAIKQLIYVAGQETIDSMLAAKTDGERLNKFEAFWRSIDPTPSTTKNEALEEYYARIAFANERFKSYNEGWLTDMGRVYVIYGEPLNIETRMGPNRISVISRWTYGNGIVVVFEDPSGFGDYRLRTPLPGSPRYEFNRSR